MGAEVTRVAVAPDNLGMPLISSACSSFSRVPPALIGKTFNHAYVVFTVAGVDLTSNAVPLTLLR